MIPGELSLSERPLCAARIAVERAGSKRGCKEGVRKPRTGRRDEGGERVRKD